MRYLVMFLALSGCIAEIRAAEFEVASIKPSAEEVQQVNIGLHIDGAQVTCAHFSLKDYVRMAYDMKDYRIIVPDWMASTRFDIAAKLPDGGTREQVPEMLQALLRDRFRVKVHRETREFPVYGLSVVKDGAKMKESVADPAADGADPGKGNVNVTASGGRGGVNVNLGRGSYFAFNDNKLDGKKLTMPVFADLMARFMDRPVVDMTGLTGTYDFTLNFTPEDFRAMQIRAGVAAGVMIPAEYVKQVLEASSQDSLFSAVQTLGLKLDRRKAPLEVLVVDSADKTPSSN